MKNYFRVMLGKKSVHAKRCFDDGVIGAGYGIHQDLTGRLPDEWRDFNAAFIPVYLEAHPGKTKIGAGLSCGALWTVAKGIKVGDLVLSPDGEGRYRVGEVAGDYVYRPGEELPHRRPIRWTDTYIARAEMGEPLRRSTASTGAVCDISGYRDEIERLLGGAPSPTVISSDPTVEDASAFAMEQHLEEFLVKNWAQTELGKQYDIYEEDGEQVGQQYQTDTGPLDILAISKDRKKLLVVELKKGRASDAVVGQALRYMGYVREELAEEGQSVEGAIIALDDDPRIRRALTMTPAVSFYRYQISFKLLKA